MVHPKGNHCKATAIERVGVFSAGQAAHNYPQLVGTYTAAKIISTVTRKAVADVFKPASAIVDEVIVSINCSNPIEVLNFSGLFYAITFNCVKKSKDQSSFDFISAGEVNGGKHPKGIHSFYIHHPQ